jgi:hypothetical protein
LGGHAIWDWHQIVSSNRDLLRKRARTVKSEKLSPAAEILSSAGAGGALSASPEWKQRVQGIVAWNPSDSFMTKD